jgi:polyhydroxyalkanoate synthesis regulator phasin
VITPKDAIERTMLLSLGAAQLTREKAEAVVSDFVKRGQIQADEGKQIVERVMTRARGEGAPTSGVAGRLEDAVRALMREMGIASRAQTAELEMRLAEVEHRLAKVEASSDAGAGGGGAPADADGAA